MPKTQKSELGNQGSTPQESQTVAKLRSKAARAYKKVVSNEKATKLNRRGKKS